LLIKSVIREAKMTLSQDQFRRQWLGIWSRDGSSYYPEVVLSRALRMYLMPCFGRVYDGELNVLGVDVAAGQGDRADWCAFVVRRMMPLPARLLDGTPVDLPMTCVRNGRPWHVSDTFAHLMRNVGAPEVSGFIHLLHRVFAFSWVVMDPSGGGLWIYKEMKKPGQSVNGKVEIVVPLSTPEDGSVGGMRQPIVIFFKRGGKLDALCEPQFLAGDDGFLDASHRAYRQGWEAQEFHWPELEINRRGVVSGWDPHLILAQRSLDTVFQQTLKVRQVTGADGSPRMSSRGFAMFEATGKKDGAYAGLYADRGAALVFHEMEDGEEDDEVSVGF